MWPGPRRRRLLLAVLGVAALVGAPAGWVVSDRLEQDDAFCVSCHLSEGVPLHQAKLDEFRSRPAATLHAAHSAAGNEHAADGRFRCIDCHGGTGLVGRARVKLLSAKDAFWYVVGRFDEPDHMRWPLLDADCQKCHASLAPAAAPDVAPADAYAEGHQEGYGEGYEEDRETLFHEVAEHDAELGVSCVECHVSHASGALPEHDYLIPQTVRAQCARCHLEFAAATPPAVRRVAMEETLR